MFGIIWCCQIETFVIGTSFRKHRQETVKLLLPTMSFTHTTKAASYTEGESLLTARLLYHLWRVDSAVRAFPHHLVDDGDVNTAKARWTIGLTLEMVCTHPALLD